MAKISTQPLLLVEDSPEDYETTVRALRRLGVANDIFHCVDGEDALNFLYRRGEYADADAAPRPGLILLDLNLPGTDGREVLEVIKEDRDLKAIPVIILTTSNDNRDVEDCYRNGANSYVQKPVGFHAFQSAIERSTEFWFEIVIVLKKEYER